MSRAARQRRVIPLHRPSSARVVVRGPADPAQAEALRRAIVTDLAGLAVELLAEGRLPAPTMAESDPEP